jgi:hypothetical protein
VNLITQLMLLHKYIFKLDYQIIDGIQSLELVNIIVFNVINTVLHNC